MKNIFSFIMALPLILSCKGYLDIKPYGKTIPKSPEEFSAILHKHLNNIDQGEESIFGNIRSIVELECFGDDLEANLTEYPEGNYIPLYVGTKLSDKQNEYSRLYSYIKDCNIIIGNMKNDGSALASDVLGTAYTLRGLCYYNLLRDFCEPAVNNADGLGVPIVTVFEMEDRPIRGSIRDLTELISNDYKKAQEYNIKDDVYRFNNDVLDALLARLYFWTGEWDKAVQFADKVLEKYPLLNGQNYSDMIESYVAKKGNMAFKSGTIIIDKGMEYDGAINYTKKRPVSRQFVELFSEKENDIRYKLSFNKKRVFVKKPLSCIRSAEMQLIKAEALYHKGDENGALKSLNDLRRNRISGIVDFTSATLPAVNVDDRIKTDASGKALTPLIYSILCERRKEMFMEGDRWYEMKRNGRPEFWVAKQGRKYTVRKFMYTFPIPVGDVMLVDGMIQNPGYERTI